MGRKTHVQRASVNDILKFINDDEMLNQCIAFDDFAQIPIVLGELPWDTSRNQRAWRDSDDSALYAYCQTMPNSVTKNDVLDALRIHLSANKVHPVRDWLQGLQWDGVERVPTLLHDALGAELSDYTREVARLLTQGAISRVMVPGSKFDYLIVLVGSQGVGKSTFLMGLAWRDDWFLDGIPNLTSVKDFAETVRGKWIVEVSELDGMSGRDINKVKAAITRRQDTYRAPYARRTIDQPRQCLLVGTSNESSFLTDTTGNRRFVVVECGKAVPTVNVWDTETFKPYVRQVWAEAMHNWQATNGRPSLFMDPKLEAEAIAMQESYLTQSDEIALVNDWLLGHQVTCVAQVVTECLGIERTNPLFNGTSRSVRRILDNHCPGWVRYRGSKSHKTRVGKYGITLAWEYVGGDV